MNTEDFVTYEQALALKKLGFNEDSFYHYNQENQLRANFSIDTEGSIIEGYFLRNNTDFSIFITAPTLVQAQKWLRKEKKLSVEPFSSLKKGKYTYQIIYVETGFDYKSFKTLSYRFNSYEEALSAGITVCLKLLEE